jgi:uncharacterized membrane protein YadS
MLLFFTPVHIIEAACSQGKIESASTSILMMSDINTTGATHISRSQYTMNTSDTTPLVINMPTPSNETEQSGQCKASWPVPPIPTATSTIPSGRRAPRWFNTEDVWPIWIGTTWFASAVGLTFWGATIARVSTWTLENMVEVNLTRSNIGGLCLLVSATLATMYIAHACLRDNHAPLWRYAIICILVIVCMVVGNLGPLAQVGMGTPIWCIIAGILLRNIPILLLRGRVEGHRAVLTGVFSLDFFIKVSICLLAINLKQAAALGARGLIVAWAETILLILGVHFIGVKVLKMTAENSILTTCALGICGGSAAMAVGGALHIEKEIIGTVITIMSIMTIPLIPALPLIAPYTPFNNETVGAWIGGAVDTTGAVSASAALGGPYILQSAIVIKMLQNMLIGPVVVAITAVHHHTISPIILWDKFPKFVLGFVAVSAAVSIMPEDIGAAVAANSFVLSEWFGAISFVLIGADIDIGGLIRRRGGAKWMFVLYLIGQTIDLGSTLAAAYLAFVVLS